jgi:iron complex outermembrane receptor protein
LLLLASGSVLAQQVSTSTDLSTVTVTGIRKGIEAAISVKKNSDSIVEAISAEDIGKLPDSSIAESMARLPGLTAQRTQGRAQQISIRGMSPDFSTALLNGREQVTTGDSRGVEFDQYPSELLSGVVVYKTPDGGLVGQGLSGTVDLQTVRPLDFAKRTLAVNYRKQRSGIDTGMAEGNGQRLNFSYIDQFADRTVGVALGFARLSETGATTSRFDSWGGGTAKVNGAGADVNVPYNGFGWFADQTTQTREGAMAVLQFKPTKDFSSTVDLFHSSFDKVKATKGFQAPLNDSWVSGFNYDKAGVLTSATLNGSDATAGVFNNVRGVVRNDSESTQDTLSSYGWNSKLKMGEWTGALDLATSKAVRRGGIMETTAGTAQAALGTAALDTLTFNNAQGFTPGFNYGDRSIIKLTDVQGWGGGVGSPQAGYSKLPHVEDKLDSFRLSGKRNLPDGWFLSALDVGMNVSDRAKTREFIEGRLVIRGGNPLGAADMPGTSTTTVAGINVATFNPVGTIGSIYDVVPKLHPDIFNKDWTVKEKVTTLYSRGDIDSKLFGLPVKNAPACAITVAHADPATPHLNTATKSQTSTALITVEITRK